MLVINFYFPGHMKLVSIHSQPGFTAAAVARRIGYTDASNVILDLMRAPATNSDNSGGVVN